jgi:hypothetical protein
MFCQQADKIDGSGEKNNLPKSPGFLNKIDFARF